jgi:hypothetical protein
MITNLVGGCQKSARAIPMPFASAKSDGARPDAAANTKTRPIDACGTRELIRCFFCDAAFAGKIRALESSH